MVKLLHLPTNIMNYIGFLGHEMSLFDKTIVVTQVMLWSEVSSTLCKQVFVHNKMHLQTVEAMSYKK